MTAVEYLVEGINKLTGLSIANDEPMVEQAKEMEKQQIISAYDLGSLSEMQYPDPKTIIENGEQYYNEKFKNK
jgi:predicted ATP-grasp superfamily ATP-dependent carboligase